MIINSKLVLLTKQDFMNHSSFQGFLLNSDVGRYVSRDDIWLYANNESTNDLGSICWTLTTHRGSDKVTLRTSIDQKIYYFSWRDLTGACKIYESYDDIEFKWDDNSFKIYSTKYSQNIGTWSDENYELYLRKNIVNKNFQFYYDPDFTR